MKLKNIIGYKIVIPKGKKKEFKNVKQIFGYDIGFLEKVPYGEIKKDIYSENLERELNLLNDLGMLEVIKQPKIGDKCYFWNDGNKLSATIDNKPLISTLEKMTKDGRFIATDERIMSFKWCQKAF